MTTDLRTELNDCDAVTGFIGDGAVSVDNTVGFVYEGTNSISTQHSNTDEHIYTTTITGSPVDLSDVTAYLILKDNLVGTIANGGVQWVLGDGTDRVGFGCGGNDETGVQLDVFWNCYKYDVTTTAPYTNTYAGVAANLTLTSITEVGLGTVHLAKAQGNVDNIKLDRMAYHANGSYAMRINGGTVGTPETTSDVVSDSITNGWGLFANPFGSQFTFYAPSEIGEPAANADVYFEAIDEQWTWVGGRVGVGHFPMRIVGNATDTISVVMRNVSINNIGTRAEYIVGDANVNTIDWDNVSITDVGTISFAAQSVGRTHDGVTFNNCDQVSPNACNGSDWTFNGAFNANGAMLLDTAGDSDNLSGVSFVSDGTGHAIEISAAGTYDFNDIIFALYGADGTTDAAVYISVNAAVTINITGGDTPTVRHSGTAPTINASVPVTVTVQDTDGNPIEGAKVLLETSPGAQDVIAYAVTNVSGQVSTSFSGSTPVAVSGFARKGTSSPVYKAANINDTIGGTGLSATVSLVLDE